MDEKKKWYLSKGVWVGAIGLIGGLLQAFNVISLPISPETQLSILGGIALLIRFITKEAVEW